MTSAYIAGTKAPEGITYNSAKSFESYVAYKPLMDRAIPSICAAEGDVKAYHQNNKRCFVQVEMDVSGTDIKIVSASAETDVKKYAELSGSAKLAEYVSKYMTNVQLPCIIWNRSRSICYVVLIAQPWADSTEIAKLLIK